MTVNDIIVLLTLIIALIAIINEKRRKHLLLKFSRFDIVFFGLCFVLINYFVFYPSFYDHGIRFHFLYFDTFGFAEPKKWAYVMTILSLVYLSYKIWSSFYSSRNLEKVRNFYMRQIEDNEVSMLLDEMEQYHLEDIARFIKEDDDYNEDDNEVDFMARFRRRTFEEKVRDWIENSLAYLFPRSWYNRSNFAYDALFNIINSPGFIIKASNIRPYFFAGILSNFKKIKRGSFPEDLCNNFLLELIKNKNFWLKKELLQAENFDIGQPEWFHEGNRILSALLKDISVAEVNQVWQSFGEAAITEIEDARNDGTENKLYRGFNHDEQLWDFQTKFAISFFQSMMPEAINQQNTSSHFWLYYYDRITGAIVESWQAYPPDEQKIENSIAMKFIEQMLDNLLSWLMLANSKRHTGMYYDILKCIGNMLHILTSSEEYPEKGKVDFIKRLLGRYCSLEENEETENLRVQFEEIMNRPNMLVDLGAGYYTYFAEAWDKFDKVPHYSHLGDYADFARLKDKVIGPMGFEVNKA